MNAQDHVQMSAQEAAGSTTEQARRGSLHSEREPENSDGTWRKFAEPRAWALKWDGFALSKTGERRDGRVPFPTDESR
jgi:hypothetical protein